MSVKKNTAYNVAGATIPVVVMALTIPPYLEAIGEARYGVLAVLLTLLGYLGLFDLGLGRAVTNRIAALHEATADRREAVFWTALGLNLGLGAVAGGVLWGVASLVFGRFIDVPASLAGEVWAALPWVALAFPFLLASSVMRGALMGREEFLHQNAVRIGEGALVQLAPLSVALFIGPELPRLVMAIVAVRVLSSLVLFALCVRLLPTGLRPWAERSEMRPLFVYGGWVTVTSAISPILSTLDRVLIGAVSGVKAVTYYTVPYGVVTQVSVLPGGLTSALFPRFSSEPDLDERHRLQARGMSAVAAVITPLVIVGLLAIEPVVAWWIGPEFAVVAGPVGVFLLPGVWFNGLAYVPHAALQGGGRPDLVAKAHLAELVPYLLLLWLALHEFGAVGAAAVWSLRTGSDLVILSTMSRLPVQFLGRVAAGGLLVLVTLGVSVADLGLPATVGIGSVLLALAVALGYPELRPFLSAVGIGRR